MFRKARAVLLVITSTMSLWLFLNPNILKETILIETSYEVITLKPHGFLIDNAPSEIHGVLSQISFKTSIPTDDLPIMCGRRGGTFWVYKEDYTNLQNPVAKFDRIGDKKYNITYIRPVWKSEIVIKSIIPILLHLFTALNAWLFIIESFTVNRARS